MMRRFSATVSQTMTSQQRVSAILNFDPPDYIPLFDQYWGGFIAAWRERHGLPPCVNIPLDDVVYHDEDTHTYFQLDLYKIIPDEDPWPSLRKFSSRYKRSRLSRSSISRHPSDVVP